MAYTYSKIASVTISSVTVGSGGSSSIDFIAIPQNYTDLLIVLSARNNATVSPSNQGQIGVTFNSSTANLSSTFIYADGSTSGSIAPTGEQAITGYISSNFTTANTFGNTQIYIPNYAGNTNKSVSVDSVGEGNVANAFRSITAGLWANSAAITTVTIKTYDSNGTARNFMEYSTATLYGIKAEV
jgi:hypothetical protein